MSPFKVSNVDFCAYSTAAIGLGPIDPQRVDLEDLVD